MFYLLPIAYCLLPLAFVRLPAPCSEVPAPCSLKTRNLYLTKIIIAIV
ncbi:MAG: hypothetical protein F6K26_35010 [Moorea sp. SIO2I5]|nr:hypothetical protein [Moorena sp. SIO2I5]